MDITMNERKSGIDSCLCVIEPNIFSELRTNGTLGKNLTEELKKF